MFPRNYLYAVAAVALALSSAPGRAQSAPRHSNAAPLQSPWHAAKVAPALGKYICPNPAPIPHTVVADQYYTDAHKSVIDPVAFKAYNDSAAIYESQMNSVAAAADAYQKTGDPAAVACVVQLLKPSATSDAMTGDMATFQAHSLQNWTLGSLANAYLKVRPSGLVSPADNALISAWFDKVAWQVNAYFEDERVRKATGGLNNHLYWAGFAAMTAAVAADDHKLFDWALLTYSVGLDSIQPDGTLPLEMDRAARALHYHLFAIEPLVMMAEYGQDNGLPMYSADNGALHQLAHRCLSGLSNNAFFTAKTGIQQDTPVNGKIESEDLYWAVPYVKRFPDAAISQMLRSVQIGPGHFLGGLPPM